MDLNFVSNYVFRGRDVFKDNGFLQEKVTELLPVAFAFQPNLVFHLPIKGLEFGIWASTALHNREDFTNDCVDTDRCIDFNPNPNGHRRADEIDYSLIYESGGRYGNLRLGFIFYTYVDPGALKDDISEIYASYSLPWKGWDGFYFSFYANIDHKAKRHYQYLKLGYAYEFVITENISIPTDLALSYQKQNNNIGPLGGGTSHLRNLAITGAFRDFTGSLGIRAYDFQFSFHLTVRGEEYSYFEPSITNGNRYPIVGMWFSLGYSTKVNLNN